MSTRTTIAYGDGWAIKRELADDSIYVEISNPTCEMTNTKFGAWINLQLPQEVIDAIAKLKEETK